VRYLRSISIKLFLIGAILATAPGAQATSVSVTLDTYRKHIARPDMKALNGLYLDGVREGITTAVALLPDDDVPFCIPGQLALTTEQAEDIMLRYADEHKVAGDTPISIILFVGLKATFPCPSKK
jgi:hypothetical protein